MKTPANQNQNTIVKKKPSKKWIKPVAATAVAMNWVIGVVAIGFCALIGVLFGGYPAAKASKLQPIDALHTT